MQRQAFRMRIERRRQQARTRSLGRTVASRDGYACQPPHDLSADRRSMRTQSDPVALRTQDSHSGGGAHE